MPFVKSEGTELGVHAPRVPLEIHSQIVIQLNPAQSVQLIQSVPRTRPVSTKDALIHVSAGTHVLLRPDVKPKHITLCAHVQKATVETPTDNATDLNAERIPNVQLIELALTRTVLTLVSTLNNNVVEELNARLTSTKLAVFAQRDFKEILWLLVSPWAVEQTMTVDWTRLVTSSARSVAPFVLTTPVLKMPPVGLSTTSPNVLAIQDPEEMVSSLVSDPNLL